MAEVSVGRCIYVEVDLDAITNNIGVLRKRCKNPNIGVIGVVKAGAYGHGSVHVARHLKQIGVERLAVASIEEAVYLRRHSVTGPIHIFGNAQRSDVASCIAHNLTPTLCSVDALHAIAEHFKLQAMNNDVDGQPMVPSVTIKIDTGMSRNGCQPDELPALVQCCDRLDIPLDSIMTHFADSPDNVEFTTKQLQTFLTAIQPYRNRGIKFHVANSGAILNGYGTDLDFIRPGISMYGLPPGDDIKQLQNAGVRPALCIRGEPSLVKQLDKGRLVGYSCTYTTSSPTWIATFPVGYADGYWRHLSSKEGGTQGYITRDKTGEKCPVVGRVSMDAITVQLPECPAPGETFTLLSADYHPLTSATGIANTVGTISYEVCTRLSTRLPRVYKHGESRTVVPALDPTCY